MIEATPLTTMRIVPVQTAAQLDEARMLLDEYWNSFGFTPCFQGFSDELANLPGKYAPPDGRLGLAILGAAVAGCAALRCIDKARCEAKRLYVRPGFRGRGVGRALLAWLLAEARGAGYREILCDTMPVMRQALEMYEREGFARTTPYVTDPTPGAIYLRLSL
jgi:putative acetyltransferase